MEMKPSLQRVLRNGMVTIPKKMREALAIQDGDWVEIALNGNRITVTPVDLVPKPMIRIVKDEVGA